MDELEILKAIPHTSPMLIAAAILYFARQLRASITHLENAIEKMQASMAELNITLTKLIVEHTITRKDIDDIKTEITTLRK